MLDAKTTAFVFPGQGSQTVGMGKELAATYPVVKEAFDRADAALGFALSTLCFEGPQETLTETVNAQPALYVAGVAAWRALLGRVGEDFRPAYVAGHSLGEFTALTAAGALDFDDGIKLVRRRGELMRDAGEISPGGMAAILGLDAEVVTTLCDEAAAETGGVLVVANDNCPGQIVIAGDEDTLEKGMALASDRGAKRAVRLPVSIAAHSPLMEHVAADFRETLGTTPFHEPHTPIIGNTTAQPLDGVDAIRAELGAQLTSPVRWTESMRAMLAAGVDTYLEFGSKNVLTGLLRRIDRSATGIVLENPEGFDSLDE